MATEMVVMEHGSIAEEVKNNHGCCKGGPGYSSPLAAMSGPRESLIYVTCVYTAGIQKQISTSSTAHKLVALFFINISLAYTDFKRIYEGKYLTKSQKQPSYLVSALDWLWARIISLILWPVHILAKKLDYNKIHSAIGISKLAGISGGGRLPSHVDKFFEAIGIKVQNGVLGSIGRQLRHTEIRVVDSETGEVLPAGSKGIVEVKGPQVMKGYYKNESTTKQVLDEGGWLNTGDIGWIAPHHSIGRSRLCGGMVVLEGRAKDTIVLSTDVAFSFIGPRILSCCENVEQSELEEASLKSSLIQQIVVIGQDQRLRKWTSGCSFQIGPILLVDEPFTIDNGLMTPTTKIRRDKVTAQYKEQIDNLYK
ncbi:unnamed protein product [Camellia sinensis]